MRVRNSYFRTKQQVIEQNNILKIIFLIILTGISNIIINLTVFVIFLHELTEYLLSRILFFSYSRAVFNLPRESLMMRLY